MGSWTIGVRRGYEESVVRKDEQAARFSAVVLCLIDPIEQEVSLDLSN